MEIGLYASWWRVWLEMGDMIDVMKHFMYNLPVCLLCLLLHEYIPSSSLKVEKLSS
jgi:hypothetical protein